MMSNFTYIANLPLVDISSPLLQVSIDTLCLVELGSLYEDESCLHESRARYVRALPMLAHELAKPASKQMRKDHILAAITILGLCELFDAIAKGNNGGRGWYSHVQGAQQYIRANGADCIATPFGWLLFHNIRHSSLCMGFANRKTAFFAQPKWLKVTEGLAKTDPFVSLYDLALQIPGILERTDTLFGADSIGGDDAGLCRDICQLRTQLTNWLQTHYIDSGRELYEIVDVRDMKAFASLCLDQTVFRFPSVQVCNQLQLYWTSCLTLDFTLLSIYRRLQVTDALPRLRLGDVTDREEEDIERDLFVEATNYCRSIPYCCEPETASLGRIGSFLLRIAQSYFERFGHCNETEWCTSVRRTLDLSMEVRAEATTSDTATSTLASAQCNVKHSCKSPMCNFRVECCAPAPLLLPGELPNGGHAPPQPTSQGNALEISA